MRRSLAQVASEKREIHAKHSQMTVEAAMLKVAGELNPAHFTEDELIDEIVADRGDKGEVAMARRAITGLREFGLARPREDGIVELTPAALRAVALLRRLGGRG